MIYLGNFVWIHFAALLTDGTNGTRLSPRQKEQLLEQDWGGGDAGQARRWPSPNSSSLSGLNCGILPAGGTALALQLVRLGPSPGSAGSWLCGLKQVALPL